MRTYTHTCYMPTPGAVGRQHGDLAGVARMLMMLADYVRLHMDHAMHMDNARHADHASESGHRHADRAEGGNQGFDASGVDASGIDASGVDASGVESPVGGEVDFDALAAVCLELCIGAHRLDSLFGPIRSLFRPSPVAQRPRALLLALTITDHR